MTIELLDYQRDSANHIHAAWNGVNTEQHQRVLKILATGLGKTIIGCKMMDYYSRSGSRCLFLAHRDRLIQQTVDKLNFATGLTCGIEKASETAHDSMHTITVGSVQSMTQKRLARYHKDQFGYIFIDEAHRSAADSYKRIIDHFDSANVVGITATGYRADKKALSSMYTQVAGREYNLTWAIDNGWLVPIRGRTCSVEIDASRLSSHDSSDYTDEEAEEVIMPYLTSIAQELRRVASDRKIILFLPLVKSSKAMTQAMNEAGFRCCHVDGTDQSLLPAFERGEYSACCNAMLLTEGIDIPDINCVVVLRVTKSTGLYTQMVGRGTRILDGSVRSICSPDERKERIRCSEKPDLLLIDFLMHGAEHDMCRPARLFSLGEEHEAAMSAHMNAGMSFDMMQLAEQAHTDMVHEREKKLLSRLQSLSGRDSVDYDPVLQCLSVFDDSISEWRPSFAWEGDAITKKQIEYLSKAGFKCDAWSKGFASHIIDVLANRRASNLCTAKQMSLLMQNGVQNAQALSFDKASEMITLMMPSLKAKWDKSARYKAYLKRKNNR